MYMAHAAGLKADSLGYSCLAGLWRRGLRNGNWARLNIPDRGLFRCALWMAKVRGQIRNAKLMVQVLRIALKLLESAGNKVLRAGRRRAMIMSQTYAKPGGVFSWVPEVRGWLNDPRYIWYLGVLELNP